MQVDSSEMIRNVALSGHNDTGKTTLTSAMLFTGGVVNRMNQVQDGNTTTDFDPEEIDREISIGLAPVSCPGASTRSTCSTAQAMASSSKRPAPPCVQPTLP